MNFPVQLVHPDIYQIRVPLPFLLNHVNVYAIRPPAGSTRGWTIIDTGLNHPDSLAAWREAFDQLGFTPADIEQIILTHIHPDHYGLAGWLQREALRLGASAPPPVRLSPLEQMRAEEAWVRGEQLDLIRVQMRQSAAPPELVNAVVHGIADTRLKTFPHPVHTEALSSNTLITAGAHTFRTIHAPGHSDGQLIYYDEANHLLLSGDQVLMKITPNIGLWSTGDRHPLESFLTSLRELRELKVALALPGHRHVIPDWCGRIDELIAHHGARLQVVKNAVASRDGATVFEVAGIVFEFARLTDHEMRFAMVEALSHLEYLVEAGDITRAEDHAGVWHYRLI